MDGLRARIGEQCSARLYCLSALCLFLCFAGPSASAQSVSGTVTDRGNSTPPDTQIVLVKKDKRQTIYRTKVDPNTGKFTFENVSEGQYDLVACAGGDYLPTIVGIPVQDRKPVYKTIILENARRDEKRVITVTVMNRKGGKLPQSQAWAYAYECQVAEGTTDANAKRDFKIPVPPDRYKFAAKREPGRGPTKGKEVSLTRQTREVTLTLDEEKATATLKVKLDDGISDSSSSGGRDFLAQELGGLLVDGVVPDLRANTSTFFRQSVSNELQLTRAGYQIPLDMVPSLRIGDRFSDEFHGSLQYEVRHDALGARNFFNLPDFETSRRQIVRANVSGPVVKGHNVWFYLSGQLERGVDAPTFSPVLTSQLPLLNEQFSRLGLPQENLRRFLITSAWDQPTVRLQYKPQARHTLTVRYDFERELLRNVLSLGEDGTLDAPSAARRFSGRNHFLSLQDNWYPSATLALGFGYNFRRRARTDDPVEPDEVSLHIPGLTRTGRALNLVEGDALRLSNHLISFGAQKVSGRHNLNGGAQFGFDRNILRFDAFSAGRAIIPGLSALSTAAPVADLFQFGRGAAQVVFNVSYQNYHFNYRYQRSGLTLDLGLRNKTELPPSFHRRELIGLQPLAGLAWSIDSDTSLRLRYNLTRSRLPQLPLGLQLLMGGQGLQPSVPPPPRRVVSFVGSSAATSAFNQFLATRSVPNGPQLAVTYDFNSRSPTVQTTGLTFTKALMRRVVLEFDYQFTRGSRLLTATNINLPPPVFIDGRPDFQNAAVNPAFAQIYQFQTDGTSSYHGGSLNVVLDRYKGLSLNARLTLSKLIDDLASGSFEATPENVFDRRRERAVSDFHIGRALTVTANWSKEFIQRDKQNRVKRKGEVFLAGTFKARSGRHFNVLTGFDANHDGNPLTDRPLGVGRNTFLGQSYAQLDLDVGVRLGVGEGKSFEVKVRSINLFNRANFANFNTVLGRSDLTGLDAKIISGARGLTGYDFRSPLTPEGFGIATNALTPRSARIELKYNF